MNTPSSTTRLPRWPVWLSLIFVAGVLVMALWTRFGGPTGAPPVQEAPAGPALEHPAVPDMPAPPATPPATTVALEPAHQTPAAQQGAARAVMAQVAAARSDEDDRVAVSGVALERVQGEAGVMVLMLQTTAEGEGRDSGPQALVWSPDAAQQAALQAVVLGQTVTARCRVQGEVMGRRVLADCRL